VYSIFVAILIGIFLPESPRFLVQQKKHYRAFRVIKKIWLVNNKKEKRLISNEEGTIQNLLKRNEAEFFNLNTSIIQKFDVITNQNSKQLNSSLDETTQNNVEDSSALRYLFKSTRNFCKTFILSFILFSTTLCYFGKSFFISVSSGKNMPRLKKRNSIDGLCEKYFFRVLVFIPPLDFILTGSSGTL